MRDPRASSPSTSTGLSLEDLFGRLPTGVCLLDPELRVRYVNPTYARYLTRTFGHRKAAMIGADWPRLIELGDRQTEELEALRASGRPVHLPRFLARRSPAGQPTFWDVTISPGGGAMADHLLVLTADVSEQVQAEQQEVSDRLQAEAILANVAEGLIVVGADGTLLRINQTACELLQLDCDRLRGSRQPPATQLSTLDGEPVPLGMTPLSRALAGELQRPVMLRYRGPESERILSISAAPILGARGEIQMAVAILQDRSELQEAQRAYAELQVLEQRKAEFLNAVSHELRTPLTAIIGYAEFLDEGIAGTLSEAQREYVSQILSGTDRLMRLINDLLDFARLEAGAFRLDVGPVEYGPLVQRTVSSLEPLARRKGLSVEVDVSPEIPEVCADPERVAQILLNLLSNAVKFTPEQGRVTVRAWMDGTSVVTEVADTGVGLTPEAQTRIFGKFYRAPESSRSVPGTGLGLALTKGLVEAHGGRIGVESAPGSGSTFCFTLPVSAAP